MAKEGVRRGEVWGGWVEGITGGCWAENGRQDWDSTVMLDPSAVLWTVLSNLRLLCSAQSCATEISDTAPSRHIAVSAVLPKVRVNVSPLPLYHSKNLC